MAFGPVAFINALKAMVQGPSLARRNRALEHDRAITVAALEKQLNDQAREIRDLEQMASELFVEARGQVLLPPPELRLHVGRVDDAANFWMQGRNSSRRVVEVFGETPPGPVLDWGCGSGRTLNGLRAWPGWRECYRGCDVDAAAIAWLRSQGVEGVQVCGERPPLPYPAESFDGLFNFSVLTHIHPERHADWYAEMHRVLKPGGRAYVTVQGDATIDNGKAYTPQERAEYANRGWLFSERPGHYKHSAVVSETFTRAAIGDRFAIERFRPAGYALMDDYLLIRR